ncbi:anthranilate synthase family protein [Plantactinospora siamensis]|uniref:anthranilate synthase n=1 Tax=Plantactinospora siamensis TaxID=555372 RepID=A0ABV6NWW6_9ACTN
MHLPELLAAITAGADPGPFALLRRADEPDLEIITGTVHTVHRLADLPAAPPAGSDGTPGAGSAPAAGADRAGPCALAVVPYRQIAERGFRHVDDGVPLEALTVTGYHRTPLAEAVAALPDLPVAARDGRFDVPDDAYAETVRAVLAEEIGRGAGANFVIHRVFEATLDQPPLLAAAAALRRLLVDERGAYWTHLVYTGTRILVGASPERHVSVADGLVMMNPISGTFRHVGAGADEVALLRFLADEKEIDELDMVLDEELKMMAAVAEQGGQVIGPYLKEMSLLVHTEYLLAGRGSLDVREVLRRTMFAPTVTGSPIENACRVIARREPRGRRYYGGVLALLGRDAAGRQTLDAPILIRTAEIGPDGSLRVPVGATLVRHSTPAGEVEETHVKAAGVLAALGLASGPERPGPDAGAGSADRVAPGRPPSGSGAPPGLADLPAVRAALAARADRLAPFWREQRDPATPVVPALAGRTALIVDGEDTFTAMLAHQLRSLGLLVRVRPWQDVPGDAVPAADLVVLGPGPGDPTSAGDRKMRTLRGVAATLLDRGRPTLAVCLGHQLLCGLLGLPLRRRTAPYQGVQRDVELFGMRRRVGFYSSFTALADADELDTPYGPVTVARDATDGTVHAIRGPGFAGVQFHAESVLSTDGVAVLVELVTAVLSASPAGPAPGRLSTGPVGGR